MNDIEISAAPGTVIKAFQHHDSPVEEVEFKALYKEGYYEVIVICDGLNPDFPKSIWRILLITPIGDHLKKAKSEKEYSVVPVPEDAVITKIETITGAVTEGDARWEGSMITIETYSDSLGKPSLFVHCSQTMNSH